MQLDSIGDPYCWTSNEWANNYNGLTTILWKSLVPQLVALELLLFLSSFKCSCWATEHALEGTWNRGWVGRITCQEEHFGWDIAALLIIFVRILKLRILPMLCVFIFFTITDWKFPSLIKNEKRKRKKSWSSDPVRQPWLAACIWSLDPTVTCLVHIL